jgi:hypothetical protein
MPVFCGEARPLLANCPPRLERQLCGPHVLQSVSTSRLPPAPNTPPVSVASGCLRKPQAGWLRQQRASSSWLWRTEVLVQGEGRISSLEICPPHVLSRPQSPMHPPPCHFCLLCEGPAFLRQNHPVASLDLTSPCSPSCKLVIVRSGLRHKHLGARCSVCHFTMCNTEQLRCAGLSCGVHVCVRAFVSLSACQWCAYLCVCVCSHTHLLKLTSCGSGEASQVEVLQSCQVYFC